VTGRLIHYETTGPASDIRYVRQANGPILATGALPRSDFFRDVKRARFRYMLGTVVSGNGVNGTIGELFVSPSQAANTVIAAAAVPIVPGDIHSAGTYGWGDLSIHALMQFFQRVKYNRITVSFVPLLQGAGSNTLGNIWFAPLEGGNNPNGTWPPPVQSGTAGYSNTLARISGAKGSVVMPCSVPWSTDLTPFIKGGSGPLQNEYSIRTAHATGSVDATDSGLRVPVWFVLGGGQASFVGAGIITTYGVLYADLDIDLLDFTSFVTVQGQVLGKSPATVSDPPSGDEKYPAPRSVLADRGQNAPPPDDRGWVLAESDSVRAALRRPEPIRVVEPAVGSAAAVGDVKPRPDLPNDRMRAR
jgi:hypothetical protein